MLVALIGLALCQPYKGFFLDSTKAPQSKKWPPIHDILVLEHTPEGLGVH